MATTLSVFLLIAWLAFALSVLPERPDFSCIYVWRPRHPTLLILALVLGAVGFYVRYHFSSTQSIENWLFAFFVDLAPEMVGMAFTVVVIDELNQRRIEQEEKRKVIEQMSSDVNDAALEAVRLTKKHNWLKDGSLIGANFERANLVKADLQEAELEKVNFEKALLREANLSDANLQGANLLGAELQGAILEHTNLQEVQLSGANLQNANLLDAKLKGVNLSNTDFQGARLWGADLRGVHRGASPRIQTVNFQDADLNGVKLEGAELPGVNLQRAKLFSANLSGAYLLEAKLQSANLVGANLMRASLVEAQLQDATMMGANLREADLRGANLSGAKFYTMNNGFQLGGITLEEAIYDKDTLWPEGFDPKTTGARKVKWDKKSSKLAPDED